MATLHDQPPRQVTLGQYHREIWEWLQVWCGVNDPKDATPEQWQAAAAVVRTSLAIQSADAFDEQISGVVEELVQTIHEIANLFHGNK